MRIISGSARGRRLMEPTGQAIRPTLDRVRNALFNMLMPEIEDALFLDLYAGTGAIGIEALSRGASYCVFVDNAPEAQRIIRENLFHTGLAQKARCLSLPMPAEMNRITDQFDLIFADPPYDCGQHTAILEGIVACNLLRPAGGVILEHAKRTAMPDDVAGLARTKYKHYGDAALSLYRQKD